MMNLSEFIGLIIFIAFIAGVLRAWMYCMKKPEACVDWRFKQERRKINQPILFLCRRKKQRREDG